MKLQSLGLPPLLPFEGAAAAGGGGLPLSRGLTAASGAASLAIGSPAQPQLGSSPALGAGGAVPGAGPRPPPCPAPGAAAAPASGAAPGLGRSKSFEVLLRSHDSSAAGASLILSNTA